MLSDQNTSKNTVTIFYKKRCINCLFHLAEYQEKIPFVNPAPIEEQEAKKQKKSGGKKNKAKQVTDEMDKMALGDK